MRSSLSALGTLILAGIVVGCAPAPAPSATSAGTGPASTSAPAATSAPAPATAAAGAQLPPLSPPVTVQVADNQTLGMADVDIAIDRGYYRDEGLDIQVVVPGDVPTTIQALATSQVDFAITNPDPALFNALNRGLDIKMLAALTRNKPGDHVAVFLVRKDLVDSGQYHSPKDLKGAPVGIPAQQSGFYVNLVMQQDGLTAADVDTKTIATPDLAAALASKTVDAVWTAEPTVTYIEQQGLAVPVAVTGDLFPGAVGATLAMSPGFARDHPEAAQRFVYATMRGHRDYYHAFIAKDVDKTSVVQSLVAHTLIKDPKLYDTIGLASVELSPRMDTASWDVLQDYFVKVGLQERKADLAKYVDNSFIEAADARLGQQP
jgi:NitT/TauT family transport system substrate-binding protein